MTIPADQALRDKITYDTDTSYFVEAGAGSGKTFLLVQRLITLLIDEDVPLSQLAAITFTEKAAEELVNRLRAALTEVEQTGQLKVHEEIREFEAADARERARRALGDLPGAAIETLHSFCLRLISMYPLEVGVPPTVRKSSDLAASFNAVLRAESTLTFIDQVVTDPEGMAEEIRALNIGVEPTVVAEAIDGLLAAGMSTKNIEDIALFMDEHWGELSTDASNPASGGALPEKQVLDKAYVHEVLTDLRAIAAQCTNESDRWYQEKLSPAIDYVESLTRRAEETIVDADANYFSKPGNVGSKGNWHNKPMKDIRGLFTAHDKQWSQRARGPLSYYAAVLRRLIAALTLRDADKRRRSGELEYHDMIYLAARLVEKPEVCGALSKHFRMVAIDEFQDTDPAQLEIVDKIVADQPGHLFTVGDPKQSIYRFRRADLDTYLSAREKAEDAGNVLKLTANFRSRHDVVGAINSLFAGMFDNLPEPNPAQAEPKAVPYVTMDAFSENPGHVEFLCRPHDETDHGLDTADFKKAELNDIAAAVRRAHGGRLTGEPVALNDIAVLVPTHADALAVAEKLTKDEIPARTETSQKVYAAPEIENLTSILRAIADPANRMATTVALRTPSFGLSDQNLAEAAQARFEGITLADDHPYTTAIDKLRSLQNGAKRADVATTVRNVVDTLGVIPDLAATGDEMGIRRVQRVIHDAEVFSEETNAGLNAFLRWTLEQASDRDGAADPVLDDGSDAVRVMTVHASKGREFPVVILGGLAGDDRARAGALGFHPVTRAVEFKFKEIFTPGYEDFEHYDKLADEAEAVRRHYVAATRAEHALVVPLELKRLKSGKAYAKAKGKPFADVVAPLDPDGSILPPESDYLNVTTPAEFGDAEVTIQHAEGTTPDLEAIEKKFNEREKLRSRVRTAGGKLTATAIAHADQDNETATALRTLATDNGWLRAANQPGLDVVGDNSGYGSVFGTVVHDLMDTYTDDAQVDSEAANLAGIHDLDQELVPIAARAARALAAHPIVQGAFAGRHHREIPVISKVGSVAVDGIIDLLYFDEDADGWVIADYKTDAYASAQLVDEYFTQLQLYAHLLGSQWKIERLELLFVRGDQVEVRTLQLA